jgi:Nucleotide modification associated domain 3
MKALLVRIGADTSCGNWNSLIDSRTNEFVYVPIPESQENHPQLVRHYSELESPLKKFGSQLPTWLEKEKMHLDPDFSSLTYGDQGQRAFQINAKLSAGDLIVFYASLRDIRAGTLVYGLIGLLVVEKIEKAKNVPSSQWSLNAHTRRRVLPQDSTDIVVFGQQKLSGRFSRCLSIGSFRDRAYRVFPELLDTWGGLTVRNGYLQRSARLPEFLDAKQFYSWFQKQKVELLNCNN